MSYLSVALSRSAGLRLRSWLTTQARAHVALLAAAAALTLAWGGLLLTNKPTRLVVPKPVALHSVLTNPGIAEMLASVHWDHVDATPMDSRYEILGFYRGGRVVATVTVGFNGHVVIIDSTDLAREKYEYGADIANDSRVLAMLTVVFVLMTAVWPLWRVRNLDVLVVAGSTLSVAYYNRGMLTDMALVSYPALAYLGVRCGWWALGRSREPAPSMPLYGRLTEGWTTAQRVRILRLVALAMALVVAMVGFTSTSVLDVGYAVMEGATLIIHGVLPYGHIPDVLHGDTYPIGSYLLYVPFAWLSPVHNVWDDADFTLVVAIVAALLAGAGLWRMAGGTVSRSRQHPPSEGEGRGLRAAIAWLTFPPLLMTVSTGTTDVALAAMLVVALLLWRRPGWSTVVLSGAAWFKLVPVALVPLLLARLRGRALVCAAAVLAITSAGMVAILIMLGGLGAPMRMVNAMSFQFPRGSQRSLWTIIGSVPLQQLAQAATLTLIIGAGIRIRRCRALASDRARLAAIGAAALAGLQISGNYWSDTYLVWVFPFVALSLLAEVPTRVGGRDTERSVGSN